jgi:flagellar basal-body rod protein FlgB
MSLNFTKAIGIHLDALELRAERTKILASNIANENTPGYQSRDIDFASTLRQAQTESTSGLSLDTGESALLFRVPNHPSQDGNTVELGVEQAEFSQNASDFQTGLTFLSMKLKGIAKAIAG